MRTIWNAFTVAAACVAAACGGSPKLDRPAELPEPDLPRGNQPSGGGG